MEVGMKFGACWKLGIAMAGKRCGFALQVQAIVISDSIPQHNDAWDSPVFRLIGDHGKSGSPPSRGKVKHLGE